jgi:L-amino acid N-acyltransferase YncA
MQFRNATREDLPEIVAIYNTTIAGRMVTADTEPITVESRNHWFDIHNPERRPLWMVSDNEGNTIGWVSFQSFYGRPAYNGTAEISIYLHEDQRGKGYGKAILQYAMSQCESIEVHTLLGFIFAHNAPSIRLFEQLGFTRWAHLPNIAVLDGVERSLDILGKRIY